MNAKVEDIIGLDDEAQLRVLVRLDDWCDQQINAAQIEARTLEQRLAAAQKELADIAEKIAYHVARVESLQGLKATNESARKAVARPLAVPGP